MKRDGKLKIFVAAGRTHDVQVVFLLLVDSVLTSANNGDNVFVVASLNGSQAENFDVDVKCCVERLNKIGDTFNK